MVKAATIKKFVKGKKWKKRVMKLIIKDPKERSYK